MTTLTHSLPTGARPTGARSFGAPGPRGASAGVTPTVLPAATLLSAARRSLTEAAFAPTPGLRYAESHLAALRCAAAVLAARARPVARGTRRPRPTSAWVLLTAVAPELGEWASFFAAGAAKRAAAEADVPGAVTTREADDLLRDATTFLAVVETTLRTRSG